MKLRRLSETGDHTRVGILARGYLRAGRYRLGNPNDGSRCEENDKASDEYRYFICIGDSEKGPGLSTRGFLIWKSGCRLSLFSFFLRFIFFEFIRILMGFGRGRGGIGFDSPFIFGLVGNMDTDCYLLL